ncbi:hypothetical protein [uncultured Chryseobacterium sp.]|uniref:hypothetical protein n=1 Tax=uncultured Chryseobacterium sp. TaxID=259322 RepID=UPI002629A72A|nr:hypothetical protein [uncultured Chryseobacterium sp.]
MDILFLIIYIVLNLFVFARSLFLKDGVFSPGFILSYTSVFIFVPQLFSIYNNPLTNYYSTGLFYYVIISCNLFFFLGFYLKIPQKENKWKIDFDLEKLSIINVLFSLIGFSTLFIFSGTYNQAEDNVIPVFLKTFSRVSLCLSIILIVNRKVKVVVLLSFVLSLIPLIYYAFFLKGSRSEGLFLIINMSWFCFLLLRKNYYLRTIVKIVFVSFLLGGTIISSKIVDIRNDYYKENSSKIVEPSFDSYLDSYKAGFEQKDYENGMDIRNAFIAINYVRDQNEYDFGLQVWNMLVVNYVPRRLVGADVKESLIIKFNYQPFVQKLTHGVTTSTAYFNAFSAFSYLGFLMFFGFGFLLNFLWSFKYFSTFFLFIILFFNSFLVSIFNHSFSYFWTPLVFLLIITLLLYYLKVLKFFKLARK